VLHSEDGLDEASIAAPTQLWIASALGVVEDRIDPGSLGIALAPLELVTAHDLSDAAQMVRDSVAGTASKPVQDMLRLNAALSLMAARDDVDASDALIMVDEAIAGGRGVNTLQALIRVSNQT
jgi:anthranilate phosphoribosyltransferase